MDNYFYKCNYCGIEYIPKKRHRQLYCSTSCRQRAYQIRKELKEEKVIKNKTVATITDTSAQKSDKISFAGVGNAAIGAGLVELTKKAITSKEDQPATKKEIEAIKNEIKALANMINQYHRINDLPLRNDGAIPYLDINTNKIVYLKPSSQQFNFI